MERLNNASNILAIGWPVTWAYWIAHAAMGWPRLDRRETPECANSLATLHEPTSVRSSGASLAKRLSPAPATQHKSTTRNAFVDISNGLLSRLFNNIHRDESGKISFLTAVMMLALVALASLIGNAGHASAQKLECQNAADSIAYTSSLWVARGMNALTATNHMLGEATAIAAVHEAFGGPELDAGISVNTPENSALDAIIKPMKATAPIIPTPYTPPPIPNIDRRIVDAVTNRTSPANGKMTSFAAIYDSRMTLKRELAMTLPIKSLANLGFLTPPPFNLATVPLAYATHAVATANIVWIGTEWIVLDALEAIAKLFKPMKNIVESQLIPTLAAHGEFVAGYDRSSKTIKTGIVNDAVKRAVRELQDRHSVEASLFPNFDKLRLPVEAEPQPDRQGSATPTAGWGTDQPAIIAMPDLDFDDLEGNINDAMDDMSDRIDQLEDDITDLGKFEKVVDKQLEDDELNASDQADLRKERESIRKSRREKNERIDELNESLTKMRDEKRQLKQAMKPLPDQSTNPSVKSIPRRMNQGRERYTQWVRASYPQVDGFRAPIIAWLRKFAPKSKAADHFTKWSNRYTLVKAWQFRSGYRPKKSGTKVTWPTPNKKSLHMFVMVDSFRQSKDQKGRERWTGSSDSAKKSAEELFTVIGVAHRDYVPVMAEVLYPPPSDTGLTTYAQAIFYNANRQKPGTGRGQLQAQLGWDTLNWDPALDVPEWGTDAYVSGLKAPWNAFDGSANRAVARVKLNWQAKLMPVRTSRLTQAAVTLSDNSRKNVEHAAKYFNELGTH